MDALTSEATLAVGQAGDGRLTPADYALIGAKSRANRLGFAVMLLFFRERGRFPRGPDEVDAGTVADLARRLDVPEPDPDALFPFGAPSARWSVSAPKSAPCSPSARRPSQTRRPSGFGCVTMPLPRPGTSAGSPRRCRSDAGASPSS